MQAALLAGTIAGTLLFVYQYLVVVPRIVAAEAYEVARAKALGTEAGQHQHSEWKPDEGLERSCLHRGKHDPDGNRFCRPVAIHRHPMRLRVRRSPGSALGTCRLCVLRGGSSARPAAGAARRSRIRRSRAPALVGHDRCRYGGRSLPDLCERVAGGLPNRRRVVASAASRDRRAAGDRTRGRSRTPGAQLCARLNRRERVVLAGSGRGSRVPFAPNAICILIVGTFRENLRIP